MNVLPRQPISIIGGGLSGLALGILLRRHGILVELFESHAYPHHRVCGEFISGLRPGLLKDLGIEEDLADAHRHVNTRWFDSNGDSFYQLQLAQPALGISRHTLDARLANRFQNLGGTLIQHRWRDYERHEKVVYTTGRRHSPQKVKPKWIGLKCHVAGFAMESDLEMHLGHGGYVGASEVGNGITNLCGLFPMRAFESEDAAKNLENGLKAIGLHRLASRMERCEIIEGSRCGTIYFQPGYQTQAKTRCGLGDALLQIPPFTGHGMAMAFESAWLAHEHLLEYIHGETDWKLTCARIRTDIHKRHAFRLKLACALHPLMTQGRLPQYWKTFGFLLGQLPPRVTPMLWGHPFRLNHA